MSHSNLNNLQVLYEDNHLIVINKRAGDLVQGDKTGDTPLSEVVKQYIAQKYKKPGAVFLGVVHRLDRPTSGIVVFARTSKALTRLNKLFAERQTQKTYWALVKNTPKSTSATLTHYLKRNTKQNKSYAHVKEVADAKKAVLDYSILLKLNTFTLLGIDLHTGRHHQIRSQLAAIGSPIKGDLKYGATRSNKDGSISLHARKLTFVHPVQKKEITFIAPINTDDSVWKACESQNKK